MAAPEEFIEIADFRPGIHSDMYAAPVVGSLANPADDNAASQFGGNGSATIQNTYACRADKTGALIPMPRPFQSGPTTQGIPDNLYTTATRPAEYPTAYLLDAEVSPLRWYYSTTTGPLNVITNVDASSVYTMWGFYKAPAEDGVASGYWLYVLGREYRFGAPYQPNDFYDFIFTRSDIRFAAATTPFQPLPAASLCLSRLDNFADPDVVEAFGVLFTPKATLPVIVGLVAMSFFGNPYGTNIQTGAIPANENTWLCDFVTTAGSATTAKKPTNYSPSILTLGTPTGRNGNVVVGMSLGTDGYDIGTAHPVDEWSFHTRDDAEIGGAIENAPYVPYMIVPHQGRIVMPDLTGVKDYFAGRENDPADVNGVWNMYFSDDILWYSRWGQPIGDVRTVTAVEYFRGWIPFQVGEDQVSKVGVIGAVTADELFIVKARGGGALVRGDLDNPSVRRLPHVESTGGITSKGVQTPIGFVYGTRTGVFVFDGGDATRKLSPQLDGFFWNAFENEATAINLEGSYGRFAYWNDMVFAPNNYAYDINTDGWWRLHPVEATDPDFSTLPAYSVYLVSNVGQLWAFPYKVPTGTTTDRALFRSYNVDRLAARYSWQSQPLVETRGRRRSIQNIVLVVTATDAASIVVTLTGFSETGDDTTVAFTTTLTCAAQIKPQILRKDISPNFVAEYIQIRVEAEAASTSNNAPKIHAIRLGARDRQTTPRHG